MSKKKKKEIAEFNKVNSSTVVFSRAFNMQMNILNLKKEL